MSPVQPCPLPPDALLSRYARAGAFTDCYGTDVDRSVSHATYVEAFYTGGLLKAERLLIHLFLSRPSTDAEASRLADGPSETFAAWRVEERAANQLLLCDIAGRTRSWLMTAPASEPGRTRLYFGSAVVPASRTSTGRPRMGVVFGALLGFHRLYSRALLGSARARLARAGA